MSALRLRRPPTTATPAKGQASAFRNKSIASVRSVVLFSSKGGRCGPRVSREPVKRPLSLPRSNRRATKQLALDQVVGSLRAARFSGSAAFAATLFPRTACRGWGGGCWRRSGCKSEDQDSGEISTDLGGGKAAHSGVTARVASGSVNYSNTPS